MGLFDKKFCDICGDKIGLLGNRKLDDGNMCKNCAGLLSPFTTDRRRTSISDIKEHLAYREANKKTVADFNLTRTLGGGNMKVLLDEDKRQFIVTSASRWKEANPDVMEFSQTTGCQTEIKEIRSEIQRTDKDGKKVSYNPPRYDIDYEFYVTIHINSPWFSEIQFKINNRIEEKDSVEYREAEKQAREIKNALTQVRQEVRKDVTAANTPKTAQICPLCGATTIPDQNGCCEYCGGAVG